MLTKVGFPLLPKTILSRAHAWFKLIRHRRTHGGSVDLPPLGVGADGTAVLLIGLGVFIWQNARPVDNRHSENRNTRRKSNSDSHRCSQRKRFRPTHRASTTRRRIAPTGGGASKFRKSNPTHARSARQTPRTPGCLLRCGAGVSARGTDRRTNETESAVCA
jgi:hypothetical protein